MEETQKGPQRRIKIREPSVYDVPNEAEDIIKNHMRDDPARSLINQKAGSSLLCKRSQGGTGSWREYKSLKTMKAQEIFGTEYPRKTERRSVMYLRHNR